MRARPYAWACTNGSLSPGRCRLSLSLAPAPIAVCACACECELVRACARARARACARVRRQRHAPMACHTFSAPWRISPPPPPLRRALMSRARARVRAHAPRRPPTPPPAAPPPLCRAQFARRHNARRPLDVTYSACTRVRARGDYAPAQRVWGGAWEEGRPQSMRRCNKFPVCFFGGRHAPMPPQIIKVFDGRGATPPMRG
jgi:hypothetical protein